MTPSERIRYIKNISDALSIEEYSIIDLTLSQFGLPWTDSWEGSSKVKYVIDMISDADNKSLLELTKHLNIDPIPEHREALQQKKNSLAQAQDIPTSIWQPNQGRVFLSHHSSLKSKTIKFKTALEKYSITSFVAHED